MPTRRLSRRSVLALAGMGSLSGCLGGLLSSPPVDAVSFDIVDVRAPSFGATTASLPVIVRLRNDGERPIPSPRLDVDVTIGETRVATVDAGFATLAPGDSDSQRVGVLLQYADLTESVVSAVRAGTFALELSGELVSEGTSRSIRHRVQVGAEREGA